MRFIYPARLHRTASDEIPRPSARRAGEDREHTRIWERIVRGDFGA